MGLKIKLAGAFIAIALLVYGFFSMESVQKVVHDKKADVLGTDRTVTFYVPLSNKPIASYRDANMRFDMEKQGEISVWLGTQKKKISSNAIYIIEDN